MIAVIDYDMGNLKSVSKALEHLGAKVCVTRDAKKIKAADKIILPGVGAFPVCMENLRQYDLVNLIKEEITSGKWFLGICLGLQLLFDESEEFGGAKGLRILKGKVVPFKAETLKVPHMGWNQIKPKQHSRMFKGINDGATFYFVHSYYVHPEDASLISARTDYGIPFCSAIEKENIMACQFHPEKSQANGLKVLKNFVELK